MKTTINTRNHGEVTFFTTGKNGYVWVNLNGQPGTLGNQICDGGHLSGSTMSCQSNSLTDFEKLCRNWWKRYLANKRNF